jgi:exopolysaccharide biosynthesis polyprenyl glycosylphosphotransferase
VDDGTALLGVSASRARDPAESWWTTRTRGRLVGRALRTADAVALLGAFAFTALAFGPEDAGGNLGIGMEYALFLATLPGWMLLAKLYELYDRDEERAEHTTLDDLVGVLHLVTVASWLLFLGARLTRVADPELWKVATFWALAVALTTLARGLARAYCRRLPAYVQNALVVGAGDVGQLVARKLSQHPEYAIRLVGFVDDDPLPLRPDLAGQRVLGGPDSLVELVERHGVERVVIAFSGDPVPRTVELIARLKAMNVQVDIVPRLFDALGPNVLMHSLEGLPLIGLPSSKLLPFSRAVKRLLDIAAASLLLLLAAPLFVLVAWRIRRDSAGPVFFRQERLGEGMRRFTALKFRTMRVDADQEQHRAFIRATMSAKSTPQANGIYKLERPDAVTRVGRWLRKTSLDELPQLLNVLRGDMSLVGPRPCIEYETENFAPHHFERFSVPAGITGLWQVTARARSTFGEALELDVAYARNWSLGLDLKLLLRTPFVLVRQRSSTA